MLENNGKMSQAQEVRAQAFFMTMQSTHGYDGKIDPAELRKKAEEMEKWLWKAEGDKNLTRLVLAARAAIEFLSVGGGLKETRQVQEELTSALLPFKV